MTTQTDWRDRAALIGFLATCAAISAIGGWVTAGSVTSWFPTLVKPDFNPPGWVFAPVWTVLYIMIAVSGWRVWRRRNVAQIGRAMSVYAVQLALNLGWSLLFFGMQRIDLAAVEIVLLLAAIALNLYLFLQIDRIAGWLLMPYLLWVGFATLLTVTIWQLNT